jgi:hypothetical protein
VWLRTADGVRVVPLAHISHVTFRGDFRKTLPREEVQDRLTLCLDWRGGAPAPAAEVGMMYLQKGLRWIPSYRITIDGAGRAEVELQGTLINELADLEDVTANLVVGVPAFAFADTLDPIAIQRTAAALSPYFDNGSQTRYALSNAIMTQAARMTEVSATPGTGEAAIPELLGDLPSGRTEDLFVFSIGGITLAKGERMVVPVRKVTIPYEDVYHLDLPAVPPVEACASLDQQRRTELASLLAAPKVMHALRLTNDADCPLTTAPALVLREGRVLAQSMLTYTAARAATDLDLTAAVDVRVAKEEDETGRVPSAEQWRNEKFMRVDLAGRITLQSFAQKPLRIEVTRHVLGAADEASAGGRITQRNAFELERGDVGGPSAWWSHWSLPWWWHHWNGVGRIAWEVELAPGESVELGYRWHYYWK